MLNNKNENKTLQSYRHYNYATPCLESEFVTSFAVLDSLSQQPVCKKNHETNMRAIIKSMVANRTFVKSRPAHVNHKVRNMSMTVRSTMWS